MRTEQEMFRLILSFAKQDENVRAVILNGSRTNPDIQKDLFQDYDIAYFVRDMDPLVRNRDLVKYFGEIMILQLPDDMESADSADGNCYGYLMQFVDGNRIDLSICSLDRLEESVASDSLTLVLLDKDGRIENLAPASDMDYHPKKPTEKMFDDCCNEFWWLNPYTAKSLWRGELISARYFLDCNMRGELMKMLEWYFGVRTGFVKSMGKQGKFLREVLDELDWQMLEGTYADAEPDHIWHSLFMMGELFRKKGQIVAEAFGFKYPNDEDRRVTEFLHQIRALPEDATSFNQSQYRGGG